MKSSPAQHLLLVTTAFLLTACGSTRNKPADPEFIPSEVSLDESVQGRPSLGSPIAIPGQRVVMVPFVLEHRKRWLEKRDQFEAAAPVALSSSPHRRTSPYNAPSFSGQRWNNIVFKNLDQGGEWLLLAGRGVVTNHRIHGIREEVGEDKTQFRPTVILFTVTEDDTNGNGSLDSSDAAAVYATMPSGQNPRRITPPGTHCVSAHFDEDLSLVFLRLQEDTNGDGFFTSLDDSSPYALDPADPSARRLITPATERGADDILR